MNNDHTPVQSTPSTGATLTPAVPPPAPLPIDVWVGADWADQKHSFTVRLISGAKHTYEVEQKPERLDQFFLQLHQQHPQSRLGVCLEQSRGPLLYALMKFDFIVLYPVNPRCAADFRSAFALSGAKSDPSDSDLLAELGQKHHQRLRPLQVEDVSTRQLRLLVEARRGFVDQHTGSLNQLRAGLKCYYPLVVGLFEDNLEGPMAQAFLRRWPNLARLKTASPATLRTFFYAHNSRSEEKIQGRLNAIAAATPLTEDPAIVEPMQLQALCLVRQIALLQKTIATYDQQISQLCQTHGESWIFEPLPGAGSVLAPRLTAAFGTARSNWSSPSDLLCLSGVVPVKKQSGQQEVVHFRWARPRFLHQTMVEFAKSSVNFCGWAKLFYEHHIAKGESSFTVYRKLAVKWIRILWRCWTDRVAYDDLKYLRALQRRGLSMYQPLYADLPAAPPTAVTAVNKS